MIKPHKKWNLRFRTYVDSITNTQGNAMDRITNTVSFCVQFSHRFFSIPHTWNNDTCLAELGESKRNWRSKVWKISTLICFIVTLAQIFMELRYILVLHEDLTTIILFRRLQILGSSGAVILQLNTVWKVQEYHGFINQYLRLFRLVEQDRLLTPSTFNRIFLVTRIITIFSILVPLYMPFACVICIAYPEVDPNIFSKLLPRVFTPTSAVGRREHWNPFAAFAVGVLEVTVFSQQLCHIVNYLSFVSIGCISILELLQDMKNVIVRNQVNVDSALLDLTYFIKLYKASYLLCNRLNDWIASIGFPGGLSDGLVTIVCINYTLLTATTNGFQKLTLVAAALGLVTFYGVFLNLVSFLSFRSKECLRAMAARRVVFKSKYDSRRLRGCMDSRAYCGYMFYFSRTFVLLYGLYIVDYTIQALLTFP